MAQARNDFPEIEALPKHRVAASLAAGWARIIRKRGKGTFADRAGTTERTVENALAGKTLPEGHTIFNSLAVDTTSLDEVFDEYGLRLVPKDAVCDTDNLGMLLAQLHLWLERAKHPDSPGGAKIVHSEKLEGEMLLRSAYTEIGRFLEECASLRRAAA